MVCKFPRPLCMGSVPRRAESIRWFMLSPIACVNAPSRWNSRVSFFAFRGWISNVAVSSSTTFLTDSTDPFVASTRNRHSDRVKPCQLDIMVPTMPFSNCTVKLVKVSPLTSGFQWRVTADTLWGGLPANVRMRSMRWMLKILISRRCSWLRHPRTRVRFFSSSCDI